MGVGVRVGVGVGVGVRVGVGVGIGVGVAINVESEVALLLVPVLVPVLVLGSLHAYQLHSLNTFSKCHRQRSDTTAVFRTLKGAMVRRTQHHIYTHATRILLQTRVLSHLLTSTFVPPVFTVCSYCPTMFLPQHLPVNFANSDLVISAGARGVEGRVGGMMTIPIVHTPNTTSKANPPQPRCGL